MARVLLEFLGSGDAFGSGGRLQSCFRLSQGSQADLLIDCGASSLIALRRAGVDPARVGWVVVSHLHGDHFAGLPFLILDGQFARRTDPLVVAGPRGTAARLSQAMEVLFPGSTAVERGFEIEVVELQEGAVTEVGPARVSALPVRHPSGAPSLGLRLDYAEKVIAYSGDTAWTDRLIGLSRGADLFVCEAYFFDKQVPYHLDYATLAAHRDQLECDRIVVTHLSQDMLAHIDQCAFEVASDGYRIDL